MTGSQGVARRGEALLLKNFEHVVRTKADHAHALSHGRIVNRGLVLTVKLLELLKKRALARREAWHA